MLKFYLASGLEGAGPARLAIRLLERDLGHRCTYDWTPHGPVWRHGAEALRHTARAEIRGVLEADYVVCLWPGGRGSHAELGAALGASKPVILVTADPAAGSACEQTCAFYHHPLVKLEMEFSGAVKTIRAFPFPFPGQEGLDFWALQATRAEEFWAGRPDERATGEANYSDGSTPGPANQASGPSQGGIFPGA